MLQNRLDDDLKAAMLARDEIRVSTLRALKSALTYASVEEKAKGSDGVLTGEQVLVIFAKESKKRQESADAFTKGGSGERASQELAEKKIIDSYLPAQLTDEELARLVERAIEELGASDAKQLGQIISRVKSAAGPQADGAKIATLVKERLGQ